MPAAGGGDSAAGAAEQSSLNHPYRRPSVDGMLVRGQQGVDVGDRLRVTLVRTDPVQGYIDFARA